MDLLYVTVQWQSLENFDDFLVCYDGDEGWISVLCKKKHFSFTLHVSGLIIQRKEKDKFRRHGYMEPYQKCDRHDLRRDLGPDYPESVRDAFAFKKIMFME